MKDLPGFIGRVLGSTPADESWGYFAHSGFWINLSMVTVSLFSLLLYIVFARTLSPETYGVYQYFLSAAGLLSALTLTGMNTAVTRAVARGHDGMLSQALHAQLRWAGLPLVVAVAISAYYFFKGNEVFGFGFLLIGAFVPLVNALNTYSAYLLGKKDFIRVFSYNFGVNVLFYSGLIIAALAGASALLLLAVYFLTQAVGLVAAYRTTRTIHPPSDKTDDETLSYGKHLSVMGLLGAVAVQIDNFLVFHFLGPATLAVYAFATAIPERLGGLLKFVPSSLLPALATKNGEDARRIFSPGRILVLLLFLVLLGGFYALLAPFVFSFLFPAYMAAVPYSQIYTLSMVVVIGHAFASALLAQKQIASLYVFNTLLPIAQIGLMLVGVAFYGLIGIIVAKIISSFILVATAGWLVFRTPVRA